MIHIVGKLPLGINEDEASSKGEMASFFYCTLIVSVLNW
jgi:hypothetical protein